MVILVKNNFEISFDMRGNNLICYIIIYESLQYIRQVKYKLKKTINFLQFIYYYN